jgi:methylated-DNA-[protein]-cysteine S-methyltransferase
MSLSAQASLESATLDSPIGRINIVVSDAGLCALSFEEHHAGELRWLRRRFGDCEISEGPRARALAERIRAYFDGDVGAIAGIRVDTGGTAFQQRVWMALRDIPAGQTLAYGELARRIGKPSAVRAVGAANGANPVAIVVPCHRVVAADGSLHGYGGGLERKRWLLEHEVRHALMASPAGG